MENGKWQANEMQPLFSQDSQNRLVNQTVLSSLTIPTHAPHPGHELALLRLQTPYPGHPPPCLRSQKLSSRKPRSCTSGS